MKIRLAITLTIGDRKDKAEDITVDLVGTHHDIPTATYDTGFQPSDDRGTHP